MKESCLDLRRNAPNQYRQCVTRFGVRALADAREATFATSVRNTTQISCVPVGAGRLCGLSAVVDGVPPRELSLYEACIRYNPPFCAGALCPRSCRFMSHNDLGIRALRRVNTAALADEELRGNSDTPGADRVWDRLRIPLRYLRAA